MIYSSIQCIGIAIFEHPGKFFIGDGSLYLAIRLSTASLAKVRWFAAGL